MSHDIYTKIWTLDIDKIKPEVLEGFESGLVELRRGVAYWSKMSGKNGIVQHIPFMETTIKQSEDLLSLTKSIQMAQNATALAVGLSTALILGALIIQTRYIASKIDKLQKSIDEISADIHAQNILYYMDKISSYFGMIESARILMLESSLKEEIKDIAVILLANISCKRNELFLFLDNLLPIADNEKLISKRHYELIIDFVHIVLDLLPKSIYIEKELYTHIDKFNAADFILSESTNCYHMLLKDYKQWFNSQYKQAISGKHPHTHVFLEREQKIERLFKSPENTLLHTHKK